MKGRQGLFITFEGTEGSGKTTQMRLLSDRLRKEGYTVTESQEPGATNIGRQIRRILLDPAHDEMAAMAELLLMFASRAQAAQEILLPALAAQHVVISDRFTDSSLAYQGAGRNLGYETVRKAHHLALGSLQPDLTICLWLDVEAGLLRAQHRNASNGSDQGEARLDRQSLDFHYCVADGYRHIAAMEPARFKVVDANGEPGAVFERVWGEVLPFLAKYETHKVPLS